MAMSRQEAETMLAIEEAATGGAGAGRTSDREFEAYRGAIGGAGAGGTSDQQIRVLQDIATQIRAGTLPPGSITGQPSNTTDGDIAAFQNILAGLPPEVVDAVLGQGATPVQPENFGALSTIGSAPGSAMAGPPSPVGGIGSGSTSDREFEAYQRATGGAGATVGNTGMPPTPDEAALFEEFAAGVRARGSQRR